MSALLPGAVATAKTGTTLEMVLLYPTADYYFGHGLARHGKLHTIDLNTGVLALLEGGDGVGYTYKHFEDCLIELRPFSALTTPLTDSTGKEVVPAVEVAKLLANDWQANYTYSIGAVVGNRVSVAVEKWDEEYGETLIGYISILADWSFHLADEGEIPHFENVLEAYDYLRSLHFAVGLKEGDYLPK